MFTKEEFLDLLNFLYLKAVSEEYAGNLAIVSPEIKKLITSFEDSYYYRYPTEQTIVIGTETSAPSTVTLPILTVGSVCAEAENAANDIIIIKHIKIDKDFPSNLIIKSSYEYFYIIS